MTFPAAELKFTALRWADGSTHVSVRLYRLSDGGLSAEGVQQYGRRLVLERNYVHAGYVTADHILAHARARLAELNVELGLNWSEDRLICTL